MIFLNIKLLSQRLILNFHKNKEDKLNFTNYNDDNDDINKMKGINQEGQEPKGKHLYLHTQKVTLHSNPPIGGVVLSLS